MRSIAELRGLRFPDEYVVKMFFKEGMHRRCGRVLELGCGSGNNLLLFAAFGWHVTGVDYDAAALADARYNLEDVGNWVQCDLAVTVPSALETQFDAILLPSVNYYIPRDAFVRMLDFCAQRLAPAGRFYLRARLPEDWRFGRGREEGRNAFRLECAETGERGLLNVFYTESELADLLRENLGGLLQMQTLHVTADNPQSGVIVRNADIVMWGTRPS
jgi:SAM-dependent methyltransferase